MELFKDVWFVREIVRPVLDIAILSILFYQLYKLLIQTRAVQLIKGALILVFLYAVAFF